MIATIRPRTEKPILAPDAPTAVVLFAGGGGIECGMIEAGIRPVASVEYDPGNPKLSEKFGCVHETNFAEYNSRLFLKTAQDCAKSDWDGFPIHPDFLHASPVCSNFSNAKTDAIETELDLTAAEAVASAIATLKPWCFTLENVPRYRDSKSWQVIESALKDYSISANVLNVADYGVPQSRERFIVIAIRSKVSLPHLPMRAPCSWFDAIEEHYRSLPESTLTEAQATAIAGKEGIYLIPRIGYRDGTPPTIPSYKPAPTIKKSLFLDEKGATRNNWLDIWDNGTVKRMTIPALARIQTFPEWYQFPESVGTAGAIIGYSVPPKFYQQIAEMVLPLWRNRNTTMEYHPLANLFPMMTTDELSELVADIKHNGLLEPVWTYEGQILDGRNRYQACLLADVAPVFREWQGQHETAIKFVLALNLNRRHLSSSQKATLALDVEKVLAEEAKKRQIATLKQNQSSESIPVVQLIAQRQEEPAQKVEERKARTQAAKLTGTNRQYVSDAKRLQEEAPELLEEVRAGGRTIPQAMRELKQRKSTVEKITVLPSVGDAVRLDRWHVGKVLAVSENTCTVQVWQDVKTVPIEDIAPVEGDEIKTSVSTENYMALMSLGADNINDAIKILLG